MVMTLMGSSLQAHARKLLEENFKVRWGAVSVDEVTYDDRTPYVHLVTSWQYICVFTAPAPQGWLPREARYRH
jgi:hypothetical protein